MKSTCWCGLLLFVCSFCFALFLGRVSLRSQSWPLTLPLCSCLPSAGLRSTYGRTSYSLFRSCIPNTSEHNFNTSAYDIRSQKKNTLNTHRPEQKEKQHFLLWGWSPGAQTIDLLKSWRLWFSKTHSFPCGTFGRVCPSAARGHVSSLFLLELCSRDFFKTVPHHSPRKAYPGLPVSLSSSPNGNTAYVFSNSRKFPWGLETPANGYAGKNICTHQLGLTRASVSEKRAVIYGYLLTNLQE